MKRTLMSLLVVAFTTTSLGGCIFVSKKPNQRQQAVSHECKPSQYWDGEKCRHKGKGKGARKHDNR